MRGIGKTAKSSTEAARRTRDRLLDALEAFVAEEGRGRLSHRQIARRAGVHPSLLHYHFGTIEQALQEAIARRAPRLATVQLGALRALRSSRLSVEDVIDALWRPFAELGGTMEPGWRNYLCLVARLANAGDGAVTRYLGEVERTALRALWAALPQASDEALAAALRLVHMLFEREALARCGRVRPPGDRRTRDRRLVAFAAAGLRALALRPSLPPAQAALG